MKNVAGVPLDHIIASFDIKGSSSDDRSVL